MHQTICKSNDYLYVMKIATIKLLITEKNRLLTVYKYIYIKHFNNNLEKLCDFLTAMVLKQ